MDNSVNRQILVSVLMPAYNGERYIQKAIDSILKQTHDHLELIVVDDASRDRTVEVVKGIDDERLHIYENKDNRGLSYTTNEAIEISNGKYIALLDDDDIAIEQRLEWQVDFLEKNPEIDVLGGRTVFIDEQDRFIKYDREPFFNPELIKANLLFYNGKFANCTAMFRRDFINSHEIRYREGCYGMQDFCFYIECSKVGKMTALDRVLLKKRIHDNQATDMYMVQNPREKDEVFARLQRESIEMSGYKLSEEKMQVINRLLGRELKERYAQDEVGQLREVFLEMIRQGEEMNIDYIEGLKTACRKILCNRVMVRSDILG